MHISIADFCYQQLKAMGKDVIMRKDLELSQTDIKDRDLLISLGKLLQFLSLLEGISFICVCACIGGDGTYLRTSGAIETPNLPILGINTDPSRSTGHLCN